MSQAQPPSNSTLVHRPTTLASLLAVLIAGGCVLLIAGMGHAVPVAVTVFGLLVLGFAMHGNWDDRIATLLIGVCGVGLVLAGLAFVVTAELDSIAAAELYPGLAGVTVLAVALLPIRRGWETALATAGAGLVFIAVLNSGVAYDSGRFTLLLATAGVVAAWDAARHAITLGDQVGQQATTGSVELVHIGATVLVGAVFVGLTELIWQLGVTGLPLEGLLVFLGAALAFLIVLYR